MRKPVREASADLDAGFTLVEVVVACVILGILSSVVLVFILQTQSQSVINRSRIAASNLAAREVDMVRDEFHRTKDAPTQIAKLGTVVNPHPLDGGVAGQPLVVDATPYTVTRSVEWNLTKNGQSPCDGGTVTVYPTLEVTVSVTWPHMGSVQPIVNTAQMAPDKGAGIPKTDSFIAVRVVGQDLQPLVGSSVNVTGGAQSITNPTLQDGCAVFEVSPAAGTGTQYTAQVTDAGYVDVSNVLNPSIDLGLVGQGQLVTGKFTVARGGTVVIRLTDTSGAPIPAAQAAGAPVTLFAPDSAGNKTTPETIGADGTVTVSNLWPARYNAYYGDTPPTSGLPDPVTLAPGGTLSLNAVLEPATATLTNLPNGTTSVVAMPGAVATCGGGSVTIGAPWNVSLLPGTWSFFATGADAGHSFTCSPGPGNNTNGNPALTLVAGDNGDIEWASSTLSLSGAVPTGVPLYALNQATAGNLGTSCPSPSLDASAYPLTATGATSLPAGTWYVYARDTATTCKLPIAGSTNYYPIVVRYASANTLVWPAHTVTLNVTSIAAIVRSNSVNYWPSVYLSPVPVTDATVSCSRTSLKIGGVTQVPLTLSGTNNSSGTKATTSSSVSDGTWYLIANDQNSSKPTWPTKTGGKTCASAGSVTILPTTTSPQSLAYSVTVIP